MRRYMLLLGATALLAGCAEPPSAPAANQDLSVKYAGATNVNDQIDIPIDQTLTLCTENVDVVGTAHVLMQGTANNNIEKFRISVNTKGLYGIGEITGLKYQIAVNASMKELTVPFGGQGDFSLSVRVSVQKTGKVVVLNIRYHVVVNQNGETTITHEQVSGPCVP